MTTSTVATGLLPADPLHDSLEALAGASCLCRAFWVRRDRGTWFLLGVGITSYAVGEALWFAWLGREASPPFPSISDGFWLSFYALAIAALWRLFRARVRALRTTLVLDAMMG